MNDDLRKKIEVLAPTHNQSAIARELKVNVNTVAWYCYKYKIKTTTRKLKSALLIPQIEALAPTHTRKMLSEKLGLNYNTLNALIRSAGITPQRDKPKPKKQPTVYQEKIGQLREKAYHYCRKKGFANDADDFAQWACEKALTGKATYKVEYLFIDYMRETKGRIVEAESGNVRQQNKLAHNWSCDRISGTEAKIDDGFMDVAGPVKNKSPLDDLEFKTKFLRAYFMLYGKYGLTIEEIADVFDVSQAWISKQIHAETVRLRKKMIR